MPAKHILFKEDQYGRRSFFYLFINISGILLHLRRKKRRRLISQIDLSWNCKNYQITKLYKKTNTAEWNTYFTILIVHCVQFLIILFYFCSQHHLLTYIYTKSGLSKFQLNNWPLTIWYQHNYLFCCNTFVFYEQTCVYRIVFKIPILHNAWRPGYTIMRQTTSDTFCSWEICL